MMIEILGANMLSPFFGTSHFVWTGQIVATMPAFALGYYAGGAGCLNRDQGDFYAPIGAQGFLNDKMLSLFYTEIIEVLPWRDVMELYRNP